MIGLEAKKKKSVMGTDINTHEINKGRMKEMENWDKNRKEKMSKELREANEKAMNKYDEIRTVFDEGYKLCKLRGHVWNSHHDSKGKPLLERCVRCWTVKENL